MLRPMKTILFILSLTCALTAQAKLTSDNAPSSKRKLTKSPNEKLCSRSALQLKNCYLDLDRYSIRIWKQKMSVSDKVGRSLIDLPLVGEKVDWVEGRLEKLNETYFVQWVAWEEPAAESQIQTKMWYVYRLKDEKAELVLSKPLVKRIRVENGKPKSDEEIGHGIRLEKKEVEWHMGKEHGLLK